MQRIESNYIVSDRSQSPKKRIDFNRLSSTQQFSTARNQKGNSIYLNQVPKTQLIKDEEME